MSRKFTDNEVRAFSKNRNEEKILKERLDKLRDQFGVNHELTSKQRIGLIEECKEIRRTTGGTLMNIEYEGDGFDISKRLSRPWAYSVMGTTYNAAYKDASIPLPRKKKREQRSKSETLHRSHDTSQPSLARSWTTVSRDDTVKSSFKGSTDHLSKILSLPSTYGRSTSHPEIRLNHVHDEGKPAIESESDNCKSQITPDERSKSQNAKTCDLPVVDENTNTLKPVVPVAHAHSAGSIPRSDSESLSLSFRRLSEVNPNTKIITLPPAYKIDSKAYQKAEKERAAMRSRSQSMNVSVTVTKSNEVHVNKVVHDSDADNLPHNQNVRKDNNPETEHGEEADHDTRASIEADHEHGVVHAKAAVHFKGRELRNYIRPEERYKLDPIVLKRRQNRMDKLAKESGCFLKKVNHENIRVEIAFPRAARKRLMTKLVQEHNANRSNKKSTKEGPILQRKVHDFMLALSDYIDQQQLDAEHFHCV